jgi:hypothetical protein
MLMLAANIGGGVPGRRLMMIGQGIQSGLIIVTDGEQT